MAGTIKARERQPEWPYPEGYALPDPEPDDAFPMMRIALDRDLFAALHGGLFGVLSAYDKTVDDFPWINQPAA